jgi:Raf kinase inhibitor-like YbhB/YbcL family protein
MLKKRKKVVVALVLFALMACDRSPEPQPTPVVTAASRVEIHVDDLAPGDELPVAYTCDGRGIPPATISWDGPPGTKEYVLTLTDPDAPGGVFVHWTAYGFSGEITSLADGKIPLSGGVSEGENDFEENGYGPPCPPEGDQPHRYIFTVYALKKAVTWKLQTGTAYEGVLDTLDCCLIAEGTFPTFYGR